MAVIAHPDDEAYSCAGLLAMAAEGGAVVSVVAATRGEAGRDREACRNFHPQNACMRTVWPGGQPRSSRKLSICSICSQKPNTVSGV